MKYDTKYLKILCQLESMAKSNFPLTSFQKCNVRNRKCKSCWEYLVKSSLKSYGPKTISTSVNNHLAMFLYWETNILLNDIIKICENVNKSNVKNIII